MRAERSEPILPSRDLDETRAFYTKLGFTPWSRGRWEEYEIFSRGHLVIHFFTARDVDPYRSSAGCYLRVKDADALYAEYTTLALPTEGIPRLTAVEDRFWGMREFAIVDPSGNLLRIGHDLGDAYVAD